MLCAIGRYLGIVDSNESTVSSETLGNGSSDATRGAGHDGHFAFENALLGGSRRGRHVVEVVSIVNEKEVCCYAFL